MASRPSADPAALDPVATLVKGYLIERVRALSEADPELFERAFNLYDTLERHHADEGHDHVQALADHPALSGLLRLLGKRAHHVFETGLRIARDNEEICEVLAERLDRLGIDPTTEDGLVAATAEYEQVLSEAVSLEDSLDNVEAIADTIELGNHFLNARSRIKRQAFRAAWAVLLPLAIRDEGVRHQVNALKNELSGAPERMEAMAELVRSEGPRIVREAYARGGAEPPDVLPSPKS